MSRPNLLKVPCIVEATEWDGETYVADNSFPSSRVDKYVPVTGPGTPFPIGMDLDKLIKWTHRAKKWSWEYYGFVYTPEADGGGDPDIPDRPEAFILLDEFVTNAAVSTEAALTCQQGGGKNFQAFAGSAGLFPQAEIRISTELWIGRLPDIQDFYPSLGKTLKEMIGVYDEIPWAVKRLVGGEMKYFPCIFIFSEVTNVGDSSAYGASYYINQFPLFVDGPYTPNTVIKVDGEDLPLLVNQGSHDDDMGIAEMTIGDIVISEYWPFDKDGVPLYDGTTGGYLG